MVYCLSRNLSSMKICCTSEGNERFIASDFGTCMMYLSFVPLSNFLRNQKVLVSSAPKLYMSWDLPRRNRGTIHNVISVKFRTSCCIYIYTYLYIHICICIHIGITIDEIMNRINFQQFIYSLYISLFCKQLLQE